MLVAPEVLAGLAAGEPSVNHMEQIALDMPALLAWAFPDLASRGHRLSDGGLVAKMRAGGQLLYEALGAGASEAVRGSTSDTVRGWGAMAVGAIGALALPDRLLLMRPFADDPHFAVREWAWLSLRPHVIAELPVAIAALQPWSTDRSSRVRRFASEVTRPRGVWSVHISELKREPQLGLPVIEPLFYDPVRYVQDSVGNWLNDASRSSPEWVMRICARIAQNRSAAGERVCRRALRTLTAA